MSNLPVSSNPPHLSTLPKINYDGSTWYETFGSLEVRLQRRLNRQQPRSLLSGTTIPVRVHCGRLYKLVRLSVQRRTTRMRLPNSFGNLGKPNTAASVSLRRVGSRPHQPLRMRKAVLNRSRRHRSCSRAPGCHDPARRWLLGRAVFYARNTASQSGTEPEACFIGCFLRRIDDMGRLLLHNLSERRSPTAQHQREIACLGTTSAL